MKKLLLIVFVGIGSLSLAQNTYNIKITVEGTADTVAYLGHHFGNQRYLNDTSSITDGVAVFKGSEELPEGMYFYYSPNVYFEFIVSDQEFEIATKGPSFVENFNVTGSAENEIFHELQMITLTNQRIIQDLQSQYEESKDNEEDAELLKEQIKTASDKFSNERNALANKYPGSFVSRFVKALSPPTWAEFEPDMEPKERYAQYKAHYLDEIDLTDEALLRSPAYHPIINEYLDKVTIQNPDSIIKSADLILDTVIDNPTIFRYALVTVTQKYETSEVMGMDKVFVHLADKYYLTGKADWVTDEVQNKISERVAAIRPNLIGADAPDLILADTSLVAFNFQDLSAEYTVLYFYDPDCGHCKKKTPILHASYKEALKKNNVEVLGICIGADVDKWKDYVKENNLSWTNVIDARGSRVAYDIRSTPTIYVIDKDRKIVAKRIAAEDVEKIIGILSESDS